MLPGLLARFATEENSRIIGAAEGSIIATIITHHIMNISTACAGDQPGVSAVSIGVDMEGISMPAPVNR